MDPVESQPAVERRNLLSQLFIVLLVGLAYQEMVAPVRDSLRVNGPTWGTLALALTFVLTSVRFFIGAQLHLVDKDLLQQDGRVWFTDFAIISLEMLVLIFLGGATSVEANESARIGFIGYLVFLLVIDILWVVVVQWLLGKVSPIWQRQVMWKWARLNFVLLLVLVVWHFTWPDPYAPLSLILLTAINFVVFWFDVFGADYFAIVRAPAGRL